ncbi:pseudouridylate synthase I [Bernardetia litoralis DSM 6794]|uniref:tRNA pseudouridine synthase A n=1 Tax=Bernardetia litoralis (strain ATCC 23117 / DSM 6794 / NBRC 15988 / NCIMB 1366 / Fx l1 / Sio-4) TaxID=880071 RepID=I4AHS0_BERLS|nr:tRNA pseudouridine(38-40) synthase TruA [Bernardetia litoralis]AFM03505.1 pseudouridylate synthase I [Bernardetia litoralis DSM 6794]
MRYFLELAYEGTNYHGWQAQNNTPKTIQAIIEDGLSKILRVQTPIVGSGRTDTGVHCKKQFAHFDTSTEISTDDLKYRMNSFLPPQIAISKVLPVTETAHARFDAFLRTYHYHLITEKNPFLINHAHFHRKHLDFEKMNQAAEFLLKHTNFESFSKVKTQVKNFECAIDKAIWTKEEGSQADYWRFTISANRFLRGMVRAVVGSLFLVGEGKIGIEDFEKIILDKNRKSAGISVPANGLFLVEVEYPAAIFL